LGLVIGLSPSCVINRVCCLIVNRKGMDVNVSSVSAPAARLG
jgi:hypothetical protein